MVNEYHSLCIHSSVNVLLGRVSKVAVKKQQLKGRQRSLKAHEKTEQREYLQPGASAGKHAQHAPFPSWSRIQALFDTGKTNQTRKTALGREQGHKRKTYNRAAPLLWGQPALTSWECIL